MDAQLADALGAVLAQVLVALVTAAGAWLVTKVPGPLRAFLQSSVHQRDVELLVGAMTRRALAQVQGGVATAMPPADLVAYARTAIPEVVAKLAPSEEVLRTVALAAIARAQAQLAPVAAVKAEGAP